MLAQNSAFGSRRWATLGGEPGAKRQKNWSESAAIALQMTDLYCDGITTVLRRCRFLGHIRADSRQKEGLCDRNQRQI